jgi:flagellar biosynthesis GTPase FlhF
MPNTPDYTISEAAALTGRHPNTIRQRIKLGQLRATVRPGKFGEEYRISHAALVETGLLEATGPLDEPLPGEPLPGEPIPGDPIPGEPILDPELTPDGALPLLEPDSAERPAAAPGAEPPATSVTVAALTELYQRHEHAMFRLGYLQGELERFKALADQAESLRTEGEARQQEVQELRSALQERERDAGETERLRQESEARQRELASLKSSMERVEREAAEARGLRFEAESRRREMESLQAVIQEKEREADDAERLRRELEEARLRLREMEVLRRDLDQLKQLAREEEARSKRPWWQFWG